MKTLSRTVSLSLEQATTIKKQYLEMFFIEYTRVVNLFIDMYWQQSKLQPHTTTAEYKSVDSWLRFTARQCAGNQAIGIIKGMLTLNERAVRKKYNRIYAKCLKSGRNHFGILDAHYHEWIKGKNLKRRVNEPIFDGKSLTLNASLFELQEPTTATGFDNWARFSSIFPNHFCPTIPVKRYRHFNKYLKDGYIMASTVFLRKTDDGKFFLDVVFKKDVEEAPQTQNNPIGVDLGINKLLTLSDGRMLGTEIKTLINKVSRKKQDSKRYKKALEELNSYISHTVNQIEVQNYDTIVVEKIKKYELGKKDGSNGKGLRKLLQHWNLSLVYRRLTDKCDENRVQLAFVAPAYTSQRCSNCGEICRESRQGERYHCHTCGYQIDADVNASRNILNRYLSGETAIPRDTKTINHKQEVISYE